MDSIQRLFLPSFLGDVELEAAVPDPILEAEVISRCIEVVRGVVQVVQNWFTGIPNPSRRSSLG